MRAVPCERVFARAGRLEPPARVPGLDLARGLAVLGMFAAHLVALPTLRWGDPSTWAGLASGRPSILFATLAGVSLSLVGAGRSAPAQRYATAARALVLWALGLAVVRLGVPVFVILPAYGLLFLVATAFLGMTTRALVVTAAALALTTPFVARAVDAATPEGLGLSASSWQQLTGWHYPFVVWSTFVVAGLAVGRRVRSEGAARALVPLGAGLAVAGYGIGALGGGALDGALSAQPHSSGLGEVVGSGGFALATIGLCLLATRTPLTRVLWPVRAIGSMPLTAYVGHLLAWGGWAALTHPADPLTGFRALDPLVPTALVTVGCCSAWALLVGRGPLEWLVGRVVSLGAPRG